MRIVFLACLVVVFAGCPQTASAQHLPFAAQTLAPAEHGNGYELLYSFKGSPDGASPLGGTLTTPDGQKPDATLLAYRGNLYGTTTVGGSGCSCGTVFTLTTSGTERVLYSFGGEPDGSFPESSLTPLGGRLYGTTHLGGADNDGSVFRISP